MKLHFIAATVILATVAGCVTASRIPDEVNPALSIGEARYFASRCTALKIDRLIDAMLAYCLASKIYGQCEKSSVDRFFADQERGSSRARADFGHLPNQIVCRVALERYGEKGSRFVTMLVPKNAHRMTARP
jgi:hypothetical protein